MHIRALPSTKRLPAPSSDMCCTGSQSQCNVSGDSVVTGGYHAESDRPCCVVPLGELCISAPCQAYLTQLGSSQRRCRPQATRRATALHSHSPQRCRFAHSKALLTRPRPRAQLELCLAQLVRTSASSRPVQTHTGPSARMLVRPPQLRSNMTVQTPSPARAMPANARAKRASSAGHGNANATGRGRAATVCGWARRTSARSGSRRGRTGARRAAASSSRC